MIYIATPNIAFQVGIHTMAASACPAIVKHAFALIIFSKLMLQGSFLPHFVDYNATPQAQIPVRRRNVPVLEKFLEMDSIPEH